MFEKVNPAHPDKIADRIAGAIVDLAYQKQDNPKIAVEVLIGHGHCNIINETSVHFKYKEIAEVVLRIAGATVRTHYYEYKQDPALADNQREQFRCGDNGIFRGCPISEEERVLTDYAKALYDYCPYDGKYIFNIRDDYRETASAVKLKTYDLYVCQSHLLEDDEFINDYYNRDLLPTKLNPLGYWTGGINVDSGATNRKIGSDLGRGATGGGIHGKDLSKADVSITIYAFLKAQETGQDVELTCAIGDEYVDGKPFFEIVETAKNYIKEIGGFEKLAEWGLIR